MRKIFLLSVIIPLITISSFAQTATTAYSKTNSFVSIGYGIGNVWKSLFKKTTNFPGGKYKITSTGPFSLIYEFGFSERVSGGIALGYSEAKRVLYFSTSSNTEKLTNFASLARANYHFWKSKRTDTYLGFGAGYYKFKFTSMDNTGSSTPSQINVPGAFGFSAQGGFKYFFTPVVGAFVEAGYVAGSYAQVGVTAKF